MKNQKNSRLILAVAISSLMTLGACGGKNEAKNASDPNNASGVSASKMTKAEEAKKNSQEAADFANKIIYGAINELPESSTSIKEKNTKEEVPKLVTNQKLTEEEFALIGGDDKDANGIRDDLDFLLNNQKGMNELQKKSVIQNFKANQKALLTDMSDEVKFEESRDGIINSWQCILKQFNFGPENIGIAQFLEVIEAPQLNTPERRNRYENFRCEDLKGTLHRPGSIKIVEKPCNF